jgi:glycerophosphoryl diester phosphodiesterase
VVAGFCLLFPVSSPAATIHAHRGGPLVDGAAAFAENSMSAFRNAAEHGWVSEMDITETSDGVTVAMHDDTLDRTTNCEGEVNETTWAELSDCRIDRIGIDDAKETLPPGDPRLEPVPSLDEIIDMLKETGATANIEVKDFGSLAPKVYTQLADSGLDPQQAIIQNFYQSNLAPVPALYPGAATSLLTLLLLNDTAAIQSAIEFGYDWVSPQWPISAEFMSRARAAGLRVAPWTIDDEQSLLEAGALGVDAVISNDPTLADRLIGPRPKVGMKAAPRSARSRPGRSQVLTLRIRNTGDGASGKLTLKTTFPKSLMYVVGSPTRQIGRLAPDSLRRVEVKFRMRRSARPGRVGKVRFRLNIAGDKSLSEEARIRVIKPA